MATDQTAAALAFRRKNWLQTQINNYLKRGYRVISQTEYTAQMVKPRSFGCLWLTISLLSLGLGILLYLWLAKDDTVYLNAMTIN